MINSNYQRLGVFGIIFLFFSANFSFAQTEKFMTEVSKTILIASKLNVQSDIDALAKIEKHPNAKNVHFFKIGNLANIQKNGLFDFNSPVSGKLIHAMTTRIETKPNGEYYWYGTVSDSTLQGNMMLISEKGKVYGHLNYADESYRILGLNNSTSAFVPDVRTAKGTKTCPNDIPSGKILGINTGTTTTRSVDGVCPNPTRVLILYTNKALVYDLDVVQNANTAFQQFTQALSSSYVSLPNLTLTNVQLTYNFRESATSQVQGISAIRYDMDYKVITDSDILSLRESNKADIVILITHGDYANSSNAIGTASQVDCDAAHAYCIVEDDYMLQEYVLAHEVGHLYGGKHENDGVSTPNLHYPFGYEFKHYTFWPFYHDYATLMHNHDASGNASFARILVYSNPSVIYDGENAGVTNDYDVSRRITENAQNVASFRAGTAPMTATISGPSSIGFPGCYTYTSDITCGDAPYSYQWAYSSNGSTYYDGSTNTTGSLCVYPNSAYSSSGRAYVRLQVTSATGEVAYAYYTTYVSNVHYIRLDNSGSNVLNGKLSSSVTLSEATPNPVNTDANISFSLPEKQNIKLELFNELGVTVRLLESGEFNAGEYQTKIISDFLTPGLYFYKLTSGNFQQTKKIIITK